jgi:rod shape-determining protein MreD
LGDPQPRRLEERLIHEALIILCVTGLALLQMTWLQTPLGFSVPLVLVLIVCRVLVAISSAFPDAGITAALRWACYGGLALDAFSSLPLGSHVLALLLAALIVALITRSLRLEGPFLPVLSVFAGAVVYEFSMIAVYLLLATPIECRYYLAIILVPNVLIALIPAPPLFFLMRRMLRGE